MPRRWLLVCLPFLAAVVQSAPVPPRRPATDWTMFGGTPGRNMANLTDRGLPAAFDPEKGTGVLWKADLGSRTYTQPVVADGRVFVGTNNEKPRNPKDLRRDANGDEEAIDRGILMCFRAADGTFLWQARHDKLPAGQVNDWPKEGIASTPAVVGDRVYYVSNRAEVVCADVNGFADGNQGFRDEQYQDRSDADVIWSFDMIRDLKVFPHNLAVCSPLVVGDRVFVVTGNGVDEAHINLPSPDAPSFIALDRRTGKLVWQDNSPGKGVMHGQWSGPAYTDFPVPQVIFPAGDGWLRAFDPKTGRLLWKFDCNPKGTKYELGGTGDRNDFIAYPVVHGGRVYIGVGQDPEHFTGVGRFWCIDLAKAVEKGRAQGDGDVSPVNNNFDPTAGANKWSAPAWHYGGPDARKFAPRDFVFGRTMSTACVVGDVVYAAELQGFIHCLDARTGKPHWVYDTKNAIWGAPYYADGKVYLPTEGGELFVFRHADRPDPLDEFDIPDAVNLKDYKAKRLARRKAFEAKYLLAKVEMEAPMRGTVSAANGVLYVATEKTLYAVK